MDAPATESAADPAQVDGDDALATSSVEVAERLRADLAVTTDHVWEVDDAVYVLMPSGEVNALNADSLARPEAYAGLLSAFREAQSCIAREDNYTDQRWLWSQQFDGWANSLELQSGARDRIKLKWLTDSETYDVLVTAPDGTEHAFPLARALTATESETAQIEAFLNGKSLAAIGEAKRAEKIAQRVEEMEIREEAKEAFLAKKFAESPIPDVLSLTNFLALQYDSPKYLVNYLWPSSGRIVFAAPQKGGKTTLVGNLIKSLADGDRFLGEFTVSEPQRVVLIDNEMSPILLQEWLRQQRIANEDNVNVITLRGSLTSFNILDAHTRTRWAEILTGLKADVLIFDCLRPVLDALGLDENHDAGKFLTALSELCGEASIDNTMVVHHMGHTGERSRGDSSIPGWPDANWKIVREDADDDASPRFFKAYGRDVDHRETRLQFDPSTRTLSLNHEAGSRKNGRIAEATESVLAYITANEGCSGRDIESGAEGQQKDIREAVKRLVGTKKVAIVPGPKRAKLHYVSGSPAYVKARFAAGMPDEAASPAGSASDPATHFLTQGVAS